MRLEYGIEVSRIEVPRFAVEAVEGIGKLFSLAALVLNVLDTHEQVEIVFWPAALDFKRSDLEAFVAPYTVNPFLVDVVALSA